MQTAKRTRTRHVALAYPVAVPWVALFARGVAEYARRQGGWNLTTSPPTLAGTGEWAQTVYSFRGWPGDGLVAAIGTATEARAARRLGIPVVSVSGALRDAGVPRVMVDHEAIGRLAAEHFLERGLRRLAFCGIQGPWHSQLRCRGFVERARQAGAEVDVFEMTAPANPRASWQQHVAPLVRWLQSLRPPVGLLAVQDYRARAVVDECLRLGLHVPRDVAVLGVDNDPTVCEFCRPALSSVSRNAWRVGYEAAALLDRLMQGQAPPPHDILIPPDGIVARQSTDMVAIEDPHVAAAVHFIRDHVAQPFNVGRVMQHVPVSRRQLELRFRRVFQCTPYDYLCRCRVERAKDLLAGPQRAKLTSVAAACGFSSVERMRLVFRRVAGTSPLEYRRRQLAAQQGDSTAAS
jgi:LacI family transcriptional regulator